MIRNVLTKQSLPRGGDKVAPQPDTDNISTNTAHNFTIGNYLTEVWQRAILKHFTLKFVFHQMLSTIKDHPLSKVVFPLRSAHQSHHSSKVN